MKMRPGNACERRQRMIPRMVLLGSAGLMFALALTTAANPPESPKRDAETKSEPECIVQLGFASDGKFLEFHITDSKSIKELVVDPISQAMPDPKPKRYVVLGNITTKTADGTKDVFTLFLPWGHFKHGNDYFIADFSLLQKAIKEDITYNLR